MRRRRRRREDRKIKIETGNNFFFSSSISSSPAFKQRESVMLSSYLYILYALPRWWPVYRTSENIVKTINLKRQETTSHDYQSQSFFIQFYIGGGESV